MGLVNRVLKGLGNLAHVVVVAVLLLLATVFAAGALISHHFDYSGVTLGFVYAMLVLLGTLVYYQRARRRNLNVSGGLAQFVSWGCWGAVLGVFCMFFPVLLADDASGLEPFGFVVGCSILVALLSFLPWHWLPDIDFFD
jgi:peptidoglycan/LPS O-acetylase OafA/YrhL